MYFGKGFILLYSQNAVEIKIAILKKMKIKNIFFVIEIDNKNDRI